MSDNIKDYFKEIPNYLSFFVFSSFLMSLSPILIEMGKTFNIGPSDLSLIFASATVGGIIGRLTSFFFRARFTNLQIIIASYTLLFVLIIILSQIKILALFFIIYFLSGYLFGIILVLSSENLLESPIANKDRLISIATSFYPLGSIVSSLIASSLVKNGYNWKYLYYVLAFMAVLAVILYLTIGRPAPKHISPSGVRGKRLMFKGIFTDKKNNIIFILMFFCMIFYVMPEYILSSWSPTFFRLENIINVQGAGYMISIFWAAVTIGRILISLIAGKAKSRYIMLVLVLISLVSTILLVFSKSSLPVYIFTALAGLGYSGIFPLILSTGSTIYEKGRGTLATIMLLASDAGISLVSYLTRTISKYNMLLSVNMAIIFIVLLMALIISFIIYERKSFKTPLINTDYVK